jgi:hypothetical protein
MTDHPPPVVQRGSAVLIRGAALPLMYRATLVLIALGWSSCGDSLRSRARCALDRPYIVRSVSVSTPRGTFMKTSACMLVASVFRVMMSDKVVFFTMRTSVRSSAFSK